MGMPKVQMTVKKDRSFVTGNVAPQHLLAYWNGEARASEVIPTLPGKLIGFGKKTWKLVVGLCEHVIEIERRHKSSKHVSVTIDGDLFVEALAEEIDRQKEGWFLDF